MREREIKPIWTTASFLVYTGGLTVFGGGLGALAYLSTQFHGAGQQTAWALLILVILSAVAHALRGLRRPIAAGIFAFVSVLAWAFLVGQTFQWWGWTNGAFGSFHRWSWARLAFELLVLVAAGRTRRRFRFPFIALISAVVGFVFVLDLITSGSGNFALAVTLIVGLVYLVAGSAGGKPSGFWLHLVGGALVGVPILAWCHTTDFDFAVVSFMSLVFVAFAYSTRRSSWAVYATIGFFIATVHYLVGSPTAIAEHAAFVAGVASGSSSCTGTVCTSSPATISGVGISAWSFPLAFGLLGFWLVLLGVLGRRRHRAPAEPAPV